jgi:hypothetical protein
MPYSANSCFDWYSCRFMQDSCGGAVQWFPVPAGVARRTWRDIVGQGAPQA